MVEDGKVRPEGCICEPCSDIPPNWKDIQPKLGYTTLGVIILGEAYK
jgi:hypothetical protein